MGKSEFTLYALLLKTLASRSEGLSEMTMAQDDDSLDVSRDATEQPTTPEGTAFTTPPSIDDAAILSGQSYTHLSPLPSTIIHDPDTECVLGIDEAGRGPVLGMYIHPTLPPISTTTN